MTKDLMVALSKIYKKSSASNKIFLMKKLFSLKMVDNRSVAEHLNEFNMLTSCWNMLRLILMSKSGCWFYCPLYQRPEIVS